MSLRSDCGGVPDGVGNDLGSVMLLHQIALMKNHQVKQQKVAELAGVLTAGSNIYSSGTKFYSMMKACE